jgi:hypothetical protein
MCVTGSLKRLARPPQNDATLLAMLKGDYFADRADGVGSYWFSSPDGQRLLYCRGGNYGASTIGFSNENGTWIADEEMTVTAR